MEIKKLFGRSRQHEAPAAKMQLASQNLSERFVSIRYSVQWQLPDGSIRKPEPTENKFIGTNAFTAAGKSYDSCNQLCAEAGEDGHLFRDIYGRDVFEYKERFPCFDSYDFLNEDRYFHWFYIFEGDRLCCVYCSDDRTETKVTEDVWEINKHAWKEMLELNWHGCADEGSKEIKTEV